MTLDDLLTRDRDVPPLSATTFQATREAVVGAARIDVARRAKMIRLRRTRRALAGVAAAAIAGVVITAHTGNTTATPGTARAHSAAPKLQTFGPRTQSPKTVDVRYQTVAQVIRAASTSTAAGDPTTAPYWKVVSTYHCDSSMQDIVCPPDGQATHTVWNGNGRPGVVADTMFGPTPIPADTITINGNTMSWHEANSRTWSDAQIASLVADGGPSDKAGGRAPTAFYVFKNTGDLLMDVPASRTIRMQLWKQLEKVPGVRLDGQATDALGRAGWRITLDSPGYGTQSYLIDTTTGMLLESSTQLSNEKTPYKETFVSAGPAETAPAPTRGTGPDPSRSTTPRAETGGPAL